MFRPAASGATCLRGELMHTLAWHEPVRWVRARGVTWTGSDSDTASLRERARTESVIGRTRHTNHAWYYSIPKNLRREGQVRAQNTPEMARSCRGVRGEQQQQSQENDVDRGAAYISICVYSPPRRYC
ncbi:hypothetical protein BD413DRAFT_527108 [Trametes elegans]|nr:hypothetical protein BD413DRAFT_527108 [Trametes elegans]